MATKRRDIVQNIVARLDAEDHVSPEMRKAQEEGRNLAEASRQVIRQFQRMDNHSAAVARNIKQLRDAELRAKVATQTMRSTFSGTVTTLDRLEDKLTLVKIKLDNMGAAGTLARKGIDLLKVGAIAAAAAVAGLAFAAVRFAQDSIQKVIEESEEATLAVSNFDDAVTRFQTTLVEVTLGTDGTTDSINFMTIAFVRAERGTVNLTNKLSGLYQLMERTVNISGAFSGATSGLAGGPVAFGFRALGAEISQQMSELELAQRLIEENARVTQQTVDAVKGAQQATAQMGRASGTAGRAGRRGGGGRGRPGTPHFEMTFGRETGIADLAAFRGEQERIARENEARSQQIAVLDQLLFLSFQEADARRETNIEMERQLELTMQLDSALQSAAQGGVSMLTGAFGGLISQLVAGEFSMQGFMSSLLGQMGGLMQDLGAAFIATAIPFQLVESGKLATAPGTVIAAGAGLIAAGAVLEGLSTRAQKNLAGGTPGGTGAGQVAQDAVNAVSNTFAQGEARGPGVTVIQIGEDQFHGTVVNHVNLAVDLNEVALVPQGGL